MYLATLSLLMTIKAYLLPRDTRDFIIFFHTPLPIQSNTINFFVPLPDRLVGTVLGRHVRSPTTTHEDIQYAIDVTPVISSRYQYKQEEGLTVLGASIDHQ
jgi:hypothetical protein